MCDRERMNLIMQQRGDGGRCVYVSVCVCVCVCVCVWREEREREKERERERERETDREALLPFHFCHRKPQSCTENYHAIHNKCGPRPQSCGGDSGTLTLTRTAYSLYTDTHKPPNAINSVCQGHQLAANKTLKGFISQQRK